MTRLNVLAAGLLIWCAAGAVASPLCGQQFWNERKPSEWTQNEANTIIVRSPWAIPTKVRPAPLPGEGIAPGNTDGMPAGPAIGGGRLDAIRNENERLAPIAWDVAG